MRGLGLRQAEVEDLPAIEATLRSAWSPLEPNDSFDVHPGGLSDLPALCREHLSGCLVAHRAEKVIGCIAWRQDEFVGVLFLHLVMREFQDLGIGTALVGRFLDRARDDGLRLLEIRIPESLERAARIYHRQGFRLSGRWIRLNRGCKTVRASADDSDRIGHYEKAGFSRGDIWCQYERMFSGKG